MLAVGVGWTLAQVIAASCPSELVVWPEDGQLPINGRILLEGRGAQAELVRNLPRRDPTLVAGDHRVRLRIAQVFEGDESMAQAWLEPVGKLAPGRTYLLELRSRSPELLLTPSPEGLVAIGFVVGPAPDESAPLLLDRPSPAGHGRQELDGSELERATYLHVPARDDGALVVKVDLLRLGPKPRRSVFHYPLPSNEVITLGSRPGCAGISLLPGEPALAQLSVLDEGGHRVDVPGRAIWLRGEGLYEPGIGDTELEPEQLPAPIEVRVRIEDDLGRPLAGAMVRPSWAPQLARSSDDRGVVSFPEVRVRTGALKIEEPRHGELQIPVQLKAKPAVQTLQARYGGAARLTLTVLDPRGHPIRTAQVEALGGTPPVLRRVKTNELGQAELGALPAGHFQVQIDAPGFALQQVGYELLGPIERTIALEEGQTLTGQIQVPPGVPSSGWRVVLLPGPRSKGDPEQVWGRRAVAADDAGHFVIKNLALRGYQVEASHPGDAELLLDQGRTTADLTISKEQNHVVLKVAPLVHLDLRLDYAGRPAPAQVEVELFDVPGARLRIDPARGEVLAVLPPRRRYRGWITAPGFRRAELDLTGDGETHRRHRIRMESAAGIRGQVVSPEGHPIPGARVEGWGPGQRELLQQRYADAEGNFLLDQLDPAGVVLAAVARGHGRITSPVQPEAKLVLPRGGPVIGWRSGAPGPVTHLSLRSQRGTGSAIEAVTSGAGRFVVESPLPFGVYQAEVQLGPDLWVRSYRHDGQEGRLGLFELQTRAILRLAPGLQALGDLELEVSGPGEPAAKVMVRAPLDPAVEQVRLQELPPGRFRAVITWKRGGGREQLLEQTFELRPQEPTALQVDLHP